eukprot:PITA_33767
MPSTMEDVLTQDVNAVEKLLSNGINHLQVQDKYILPPSERPHLSKVSYSESIRVVDLKDLDGPNRTRIVEEIHHACEEDGFFQDVNAVEKLLSNGTNHLQVQDKYILPPSERPHLSEVSYSESIRVVDLKDLNGPNRTRIVEEIHHACEEDEFFQVVSNGNLTILLLMLIICQVVSNGRFRSVEHRAVTNASAARISIPTFYGPSEDAFIALAASLVDEQHPARYKGYKFGEFMRIFWSQELNNKTVLDHFKIEYAENNGE